MGREIRRVPPNWEHPKKSCPNYRTGILEEHFVPMYDRSVEEAWQEWNAEYQKWVTGGHDEVIAKYGAENYPKNEPYKSFCEWHGDPPEPKYYRPLWNKEEMTWWQVYETVSEGTPVSPPFETQSELVEYLVQNGDYWDQKRRAEGKSSMRCDPWTRQEAESFVYGSGWAPSLVATSDGQILSGVEALHGSGMSSEKNRLTPYLEAAFDQGLSVSGDSETTGSVVGHLGVPASSGITCSTVIAQDLSQFADVLEGNRDD